MIRFLEEAAINAWPAQHTLLYDGWVLRFSNGYTRRANSINPIYPGTLAVEEKIRRCEALYREQGLPPVYKMTDHCSPPDLDAILAAQGYREDARTSVQLVDLAQLPAAPGPQADLSAALSVDWFTAFCRMSGIAPQRQIILRSILNAIVPRTCYASIAHAGRIVACGLGVLEAGHVGLFEIVTDAACRQQGYGERIVRSILDWGRTNGAHTSYLQVMLNNDPALRLYAKCRYQERYQYWYRMP